MRFSALRNLYLLTFLGLVVLGQSGCCTGHPEQESGGCQQDTDCKGDRVCVNGACTNPPSAKANPQRAQPVQPVQPVQPADPPPNYDGIPGPSSAIPTGDEFNEVREVTVTGSSALNCETKRIREWLRVMCSRRGSDYPTEIYFTRTDGVQTRVSPPGNGFVSALTQVVRGKTVQANFSWDTGGRSWGQQLTVTWPHAAGRPSMYFTPVQ